MKRFKAGGRELALVFTLAVMDRLEQELGKPIDLNDIKETIIEETQDRHKLVRLLLIMAEEGAAAEGQTLDVDAAQLSRLMRPGDLVKARLAVLEAATEGMSMETAEGDEGEEVDLVLEEIKKKQEPGA